MLQKCILKSWTLTSLNACAVHFFSDILGFLKYFHLNSIHLSSISLLIVLISSFFCWILDLFIIFLSIVLHHISGVLSFDFAPEGAGRLHHWTKFQLNLNLIAWGISSLGASCSPLSASSADYLITSHNISDLSLLDRYRDSLNPDSWGSSLILGMILWIIIRSYQLRYLGVLPRSLRIKLHSGDNP